MAERAWRSTLSFGAAVIWLKKVLEKKFQSFGCPATLHMETRLAESIPSLKNLRPIPGASGDLLSAVGAAAEDNLMSPLSAPLKIPLYGFDLATNLTLPTDPTE